MNGVVELPPEALPLNPHLLYNILSKASSSDQQQVKTGTQQLQNWERQPRYYSSLQTIYIDTSLPLEIRYLAAIQLKNGIDKYWRKTASNAIKKDEKLLIRSRCVDSGVTEADHRLALQNALVIAKIVRFEYPHDWPDAISTLASHHLRIASQTTENPIYLSRTLLILLYMVKELSTGRLQRTRASLQSAAPEIFQILGNTYVEKVQIWLNFIHGGGEDEGGALNAVEQSLLALRILRRLIIAGFEHPNRNRGVTSFWQLIRTHFNEMFSIASHEPRMMNAHIKSFIEKHLVQMSKLHIEVVKTHPAAFVLLPGSVGLAQAYWSLLVNFGQSYGSQSATISVKVGTEGDADDDEVSYSEKLCLKGLLLLRGCVKMVYNPVHTFKYQHPEDKEERSLAVEKMESELLTEQLAHEMMETLVTRFFVFRPKDLREWMEEPEEWERREEGEGDAWEFSIRSCAEKLFLDLVINRKDTMIQPLLQVFYSVASPSNTNILLKDSIYAAIGLAAPVVEQYLDFESFLNSTLVAEVQIEQPGYNILRRRIAIMLGQWLPVKEGLDRPTVYQIFLHLLDKENHLNDQVVRVTAARQLKNLVDPFEFTAESFMPYAPTILSRMMAVVEEVEMGETKMAILSTISVIVVKMEHHITPFADQIISLLPPLWTQAGDEFLMKQSILTILANLITSMKSESRRYHSMILPLIQSSIATDSETRPYLLEDALDLWSAILIQTPDPTPEIIDLVHFLFPIFETASENLRKALDITESYILLAPQPMLEISEHFLSAFTLLVGSVKREANGIITHLVELLIRAAESTGDRSAVGRLTEISFNTSFMCTVMTDLRSAYDAHQTTGPNRTYSDVDGVVETDYLSILARITLASPSIFATTIASISDSRKEKPEELLRWLLTEWFSHLENIGDTTKKKLMCLALTSLLDLGPNEWLLGRLQDFITMWTDVINECVEYLGEGEGKERDTLVYFNPEELVRDGGSEAPEDQRRRSVLFADPIHRVNIKDFVREHLQSTINAAGGQDAFQQQWLVNVDVDVIKAFGTLGVL